MKNPVWKEHRYDTLTKEIKILRNEIKIKRKKAKDVRLSIKENKIEEIMKKNRIQKRKK